MVDITMCSSETCPVRENCRRNVASGTTPSEKQSWYEASNKLWSIRKIKGQKAVYCPYFWEAYKGKTDAA